jgi:hypothetical protein
MPKKDRYRMLLAGGRREGPEDDSHHSQASQPPLATPHRPKEPHNALLTAQHSYFTVQARKLEYTKILANDVTNNRQTEFLASPSIELEQKSTKGYTGCISRVTEDVVSAK